MSPTTVVAIVPMKPLSQAKTRLSEDLSLGQRGSLTLNLFRRVVKTIAQTAADPLTRTPIEEVWVVGGDTMVRDAALSHGAQWLEDEASDLNGTMAMAFRWALESGRGALFLPADLPFLGTEDIQGIMSASGHLKSLVLSPADAEGGTNGILLPPGLPHPFTPMMGLNSFSRHLAQAGSLGLPVAIYYSLGLGFDLDTSEDLQTYERLEPGLLATLTHQ